MRKNITLFIVLGIISALAFPPFQTGFLAYGVLIPFFILLKNANIKQAFSRGYIAGFFYFATTVFWIGWATVPGMIGALLVLPLYTALFSLLLVFFQKRLGSKGLFVAPFIWVSIELLLSVSEFCFPWPFLGYTQTYYLPLIQYAEFTSVYGPSFWVAFMNVLIFRFYESKNKNYIYAVILLFIIPLAHGLWTMSQETPSKGSMTVSLIQGNMSNDEKWEGNYKENNYKVYHDLSKSLSPDLPDLLIWPETAMPFYMRSDSKVRPQLYNFIDSLNVNLITGTIDFQFNDDASYQYYNAAFLIEPGKFRSQSYYKQKLAMFSERVPYKNYFPFNVLKDVLYDLGIGDYSIGNEIKNFIFFDRNTLLSGSFNSADTIKAGTAICYESVFPDHVRRYTKNGAELLTVITNDAWFGNTSGPYQHSRIAVFRAIENRREIARCANTGKSSFIDRYGRMRKTTSWDTRVTVTDDVQLYDDLTFYTKYGNIFVYIIAAILFLMFGICIFLKEKKI